MSSLLLAISRRAVLRARVTHSAVALMRPLGSVAAAAPFAARRPLLHLRARSHPPRQCAQPVAVAQPLRRALATAAAKDAPSETVVVVARRGLWRRFIDRLERIPKPVRIGFRVVRVGFLAVTLYSLGKAEGMAEYATNPEAYRRGITLQLVAQFVQPGVAVQDAIVTGSTEARVMRIMTKVVQGAQKTLARLLAAETDPTELQRLQRAQVMLQRQWNVLVLDCDSVNAFVHPLLPGVIFFLTGLVGPAADFSDEEIAMVCAHELSHALLEHGREALATQGMIAALKMAVLTALDPTGVLTLVVEVLLSPFTSVAFELPHSRAHETEADGLGIQFVADSCFNLEKASQFFLKLHDVHEGNDSSWASTHPLPKDRHEAVQMLIDDPVLLALDAECEDVKGTLHKTGLWGRIVGVAADDAESAATPA